MPEVSTKEGTSVLQDQEQGQGLGSPPLHIERGPHYGVLTLWWRIEQPELDGT